MTGAVLTDVHREDAGAFTAAWGLELPGSFVEGAAAEYAAVGESVGLFDESYRGVIDFLGEDVAAMLDKVVSSPVLALENQAGQGSCILSAKGRLLGAFSLYRLSAEHFRAILAEPVRDLLLESLRKYAFLSDIEVRDATSEFSVLALRGPRAASVLKAAGGSEAPAVFQVASVEAGEVSIDCVCAGESAGYELWVPTAELVGLWGGLRDLVAGAGGQPVGWEAAEAWRIETGRASYGRDYDGDFFPVEVNEEHRLSYDKCYVGQEVVARMRTYGHANRKLFHLFSANDVELGEGVPVYSDSVEAGRIGTACHSFAHSRPLALAMIQRKFFNTKGLHLEGGEPVELAELPGRGE
ncbi:MAG: hypothetical protein VYB15_01935 [Planctomycetota bacterium]|nr:hypothetical protein [Planctomycetota bacterium]